MSQAPDPPFDIYLRQGFVHGGEWCGYRLAWKEIGRVPMAQGDLAARPYRRWRPLVFDPLYPNDPAYGSWAAWRTRLQVAMLPNMVGVNGEVLSDGRTFDEWRSDLQTFSELPGLQMWDIDGEIRSVRFYGYVEEELYPNSERYPGGQGWLVTVDLVQIP